jgi:hypothetical protein
MLFAITDVPLYHCEVQSLDVPPTASLFLNVAFEAESLSAECGVGAQFLRPLEEEP